MRRAGRTISIMAAATAALNILPACAADGSTKRQRGAIAQQEAARSRIAIVDAGPDRMSSALVSDLVGPRASACGDCDFEKAAVRKFLPGEMTLKFRPIGGTFSLHF